LLGILKAIEAVGVCGVRSKKFIVDAAFIVKMCSMFVEEYPVFDQTLFDPDKTPVVDSERSILWLRGVAIILLGLEVGARAGEVANMTVCCWQQREDGSVFVSVNLAKNGKNGEVAGAVLVPGQGVFAEDHSAVSFFEEYYFPFLASQGLGVSSRCVTTKFRTTICPHCSPMFPSWSRKKDKGSISNVSTSQVTTAVKKWAEKIGRDAKNYSAISFRRGSVSIAAAAKVDRNIRKKHCRWKGEFTQDIYTEISSSESKEYGTALREAVAKAKRAKGKKVSFEFQA
jgi:integrase